MANTTNFGWETPDDTDLVKDGAAAIRTVAGAIDTSLVDLKGGTTNQVLAKNSNTDMDFKWVADAAGMTNPMTTTGDVIYSSSGSTPARLGIGTANQVLQVNSGATAIEWATPTGSSGPSFGVYGSAAQTGISNATFTKVALNTELWDTDSCYNTSTYRFTPNKAGYYQINTNIQTVMSPVDLAVVVIYKNGSEFTRVHRRDGLVNLSSCSAALVYLNGTTDYIEFFAYIASTTTRNIELDSAAVTTGVWIRS